MLNFSYPLGKFHVQYGGTANERCDDILAHTMSMHQTLSFSYNELHEMDELEGLDEHILAI